ncbi:hypothetical protein Agub_g8829, partial [Astrephomene gubernaculifera]
MWSDTSRPSLMARIAKTTNPVVHVLIWFALVCVCTGQPQPFSYPTPSPPGAGVNASDYDYETLVDLLTQSNDDRLPLVNYTRDLLSQNLSVFGQAVRIRNNIFLSHRCQVLYLGNPNWANLKVDVNFVGGNCTGTQRPQAFFAYIDGYNAPSSLSAVTLSSSKAPWAAVVAQHATNTATTNSSSSAGRRSVLSPHAREAGGKEEDIELQQQQKEEVGEEEEQGLEEESVVGGLWSSIKRRLVSVSSLSTGGLSFKSAYDGVRGQALATQELLNRGEKFVPGPEGPLAVPALVSPRTGGSVASHSRYTEGAMLNQLEEGGTSDTNMKSLKDSTNVYWAPEVDCLSVMGLSGGVKRRTSGSSGSSSKPQQSTNSKSSCFVTQTVLYIYNPCAPDPSDDSSTSSGTDNTSGGGHYYDYNDPPSGLSGAPSPPKSPFSSSPPSPASNAANSSSSGGGSSSGVSRRLLDEGTATGDSGNSTEESPSSNGSIFTTEEEVDWALQGALDVQGWLMSWDAPEGYVEVTVKYTPYTKCFRKGVDTLADVSLQVMIFSALVFGWLLLLLLLPTLYRLVLEFPFNIVRHGVRTLLGRHDTLKPLAPGL